MNWLRFPLLFLVLCSIHSLPAQLGDWNYRMPVQVFEEAGATTGGYPVLLFVDTQSLIAANQLQPDGRDIRFADSCGQNLYFYHIESGLNTDSTRIWVRIPGISPFDTLNFYLYHGQPQAAPASTLTPTFLTTFESNGNVTLSGAQVVDWFHLRTGDTLFLSGPGKVLVQARNVILDGVVMGNGRGEPAPGGLSQSGNGPGGGTTSLNAGAGGGAYGGSGGKGGYDFADTPGAGGDAYGTATGTDLNAGSSGASSPQLIGGAGGAGFDVRAEAIRVESGVWCNGEDAQQPGVNQGGGGGAGGGIQFIGKYVELDGVLEAKGGAGSQGFSASNDDGGGGGGGRVKIRVGKWLKNNAQVKVQGGLGGTNGSQAPGEDGGPGTVFDSLIAFPTIGHVLGTSQLSPLPADPQLQPDPTVICSGEPVTFALPPGYSNYDFLLNGVLAQNGPDSVWVVDSLNSGWIVQVAASSGTCLLRDTLVAQVAPAPVVSIVASDSAPCQGDTVQLDVGGGWTQVHWSTGDSTPVTEASFSGFYDVTVRDANMCTARDTYAVNLGAIPFPNITVTGLPACEGEVLTLSTGSFPSYLWSNSGTGPSILIANSGTYSVTVTNLNGCANSASVNIALDSLPTPTISRSGNTLSTEVGYLSYQWLYNGSSLTGETTPVHQAAFNGNYSVEVEGQNGCLGRSAIEMVIVGAGEMMETDMVAAVPNPSPVGAFRLQGQLSFSGPVQFEIHDGRGQLLRRWNRDLPAGEFIESVADWGATPGLYWVRLSAGEFSQTVPILLY